MSESLARRHDRPVPRYTSYPTAAQFGEAVNGAVYAGWLEALAPGASLSLYVHIPFCRTLCWFCGCHTNVLNRRGRLDEYISLLKTEATLVNARLDRPRLAALHWGGGTPTLLAPEAILDLAAHLATLFPPRDGFEFAVEVDPRGFSRQTAQALGAAGVNRASLGVQDIDPAVQALIHRRQSLDETRRAAGWLREAGIGSINVDLLYGLPGQTEAGVAAGAAAVAAAIAPERIAVFGYAHVPWMKRHQKMLAQAPLPEAGERFRQAQAMAAALDQHGYRRIGLDHYAKATDALARAAATGSLHRNFQGYTTDEAQALIGLGASAIGHLPEGYAQNAVALDNYAEAIADRRLATRRGVRLKPDDRLRGAVIERIMCDLKVDLAALARVHDAPADALDGDLAKLAPYAAEGLVEIANRTVIVSERGRPFARLLAACFDAYHRPGAETRHARAI